VRQWGDSVNSAAPDTLAGIILDARAALEQARSLLLDPAPQNIDLACLALSRAIQRIESLRAALEASELPDRDLMASASLLRAEVDTIVKLLDCAASFHANLFRSMAQASCSAEMPAAAPDAVRHVQLSA
jgi:hypothetical protein